MKKAFRHVVAFVILAICSSAMGCRSNSGGSVKTDPEAERQKAEFLLTAHAKAVAASNAEKIAAFKEKIAAKKQIEIVRKEMRATLNDDPVGASLAEAILGAMSKVIDGYKGPAGSLLVTGPPGTGKTWVVKEVFSRLDQAENLNYTEIRQGSTSLPYQPILDGLAKGNSSKNRYLKRVYGIILDEAQRTADSNLSEEEYRKKLEAPLREQLKEISQTIVETDKDGKKTERPNPTYETMLQKINYRIQNEIDYQVRQFVENKANTKKEQRIYNNLYRTTTGSDGDTQPAEMLEAVSASSNKSMTPAQFIDEIDKLMSEAVNEGLSKLTNSEFVEYNATFLELDQLRRELKDLESAPGEKADAIKSKIAEKQSKAQSVEENLQKKRAEVQNTLDSLNNTLALEEIAYKQRVAQLGKDNESPTFEQDKLANETNWKTYSTQKNDEINKANKRLNDIEAALTGINSKAQLALNKIRNALSVYPDFGKLVENDIPESLKLASRERYLFNRLVAEPKATLAALREMNPVPLKEVSGSHLMYFYIINVIPIQDEVKEYMAKNRLDPQDPDLYKKIYSEILQADIAKAKQVGPDGKVDPRNSKTLRVVLDMFGDSIGDIDSLLSRLNEFYNFLPLDRAQFRNYARNEIKKYFKDATKSELSMFPNLKMNLNVTDEVIELVRKRVTNTDYQRRGANNIAAMYFSEIINKFQIASGEHFIESGAEGDHTYTLNIELDSVKNKFVGSYTDSADPAGKSIFIAESPTFGIENKVIAGDPTAESNSEKSIRLRARRTASMMVALTAFTGSVPAGIDPTKPNESEVFLPKDANSDPKDAWYATEDRLIYNWQHKLYLTLGGLAAAESDFLNNSGVLTAEGIAANKAFDGTAINEIVTKLADNAKEAHLFGADSKTPSIAKLLALVDPNYLKDPILSVLATCEPDKPETIEAAKQQFRLIVRHILATNTSDLQPSILEAIDGVKRRDLVDRLSEKIYSVLANDTTGGSKAIKLTPADIVTEVNSSMRAEVSWASSPGGAAVLSFVNLARLATGRGIIKSELVNVDQAGKPVNISCRATVNRTEAEILSRFRSELAGYGSFQSHAKLKASTAN